MEVRIQALTMGLLQLAKELEPKSKVRKIQSTSKNTQLSNTFDFEPTLDTCWFGRVVLLCRFRVKTDMKDNKGRSVLMDCDCALIDCLYDYAPGGYKCIFVCQSTTLSKQCANLHQTMYKPLSYMFKHTPNCIKTLQTFNKLCANQQNCI